MLRDLPSDLTGAAIDLVNEAAQNAETEIAAGYHQGTTGTCAPASASPISRACSRRSPCCATARAHAWLWDNGSQLRHYSGPWKHGKPTGAMWGKTGPPHTFVKGVIKHRRLMYERFTDLAARARAARHRRGGVRWPTAPTSTTRCWRKLGGDAQLLALMPNGVYWDVAMDQMTRFVIVSLVDETDAQHFNGRSHEDALYLVKAVGLVDDQSRHEGGRGAHRRAARPPDADRRRLYDDGDLPRSRATARPKSTTSIRKSSGITAGALPRRHESVTTPGGE